MRNVRVLIVDDEKLLCRVMRDFLQEKGLSMDIAFTGGEGLDLLLKRSFDAVIVDHRLTDMTGNDFILKAHKIMPGMKFIIYTGMPDYRVTDDLKDIGMNEDSFLLKPVFDLNILYNKILEKLMIKN